MTLKNILIILIGLIATACNDGGSKISTVSKKTVNFKLENHSALIYVPNQNKIRKYEVADGELCVFTYEKKGVIYANAEDYDAQYTESIIFEFDPTLGDFHFTDGDLTKIHCLYSWKASTKKPTTEIRIIEKGSIRGQKLYENTWSISVNIDSGFKVGSSRDKRNTRKIKFETEIQNGA